jgi:hypothetical protein
MESYTARAPPQKLKDSCDLCSASKLRCDKQKPTCARCASLDQLCSYSPARRSGRPHRVRRERSQHTETARHSDRSSSNQMNRGSTALLGPQTNNQRQETLGKRGHHHSPSAESFISSCLAPDITGGGDCTKTALYILEQLNASRRNDVMNAGLTTTEACQRLLAILICPCSEQPGVALLVASGCISLMDTVHDLSHGQASRDTTNSEICPSTTLTPSTEQGAPVWSVPSPSQRLLNSSPGGVEELAKIAKVILQFADKYCQDSPGGVGWPHTSWLVAPIVPLLRNRLQCVTREAARRLVF